jgi:hypothetical protein
MVKSKTQVKIMVDKFVDNIKNKPFKTNDVVDIFKDLRINNINMSPNRLRHYIKQTGKVEYDYQNKQWVKLKPTIKLK